MIPRVFPLLCAFSIGLLSAQDGDVVFHSDVSLVRVDAQVVDRDNRAITGLRISDFVLREEGRPQPIRNFASENMPVDVLFLLDVSGSMRPHVQRIADAASQALRALGAEDRVAIMVFDRQTRLRMPFRKSRADVMREFDRLLDQETFRGGTDITRSLYDAASYIGREGRREARRAIVILTDDETEFNRDEEGVSRALTRADAVLCALLAPDALLTGSGMPRGGRIPQGGGSWPGSGPSVGGPLGGIILGRPRGYPGGGGQGPTMRGPRTHSAGTAQIARQSGGDSMPVDYSSALESTLSRIRQRYALYFNLPAGVKRGEERRIEVSLVESARQRYPNSEVRYRRVYLAPVDGAARNGEPMTITQAPVDSEPTAIYRDSTPKRRPAVSDTPASRQGPLDTGGGWRPADAPPAKPSANDSKPADPKPTGGWRKATPEEK
jgi:VWFA-related protein